MALSDRPNSVVPLAANSALMSGLNQQANQANVLPASLVLTGVAAGVVLNPQNPTLALVCPLSPNEGNEATPFDLYASGYVTTANASNIVGKLAAGTSTTDATNTALGSSSASAVGTTTAPWKVHCELLYDSVSGKLTGTVEWLVNNILTVKAAIATIITGVKDANSPVANFVLSFSSSAAAGGAATTVVVKKFSVG
jgi:hypothetical protein